MFSQSKGATPPGVGMFGAGLSPAAAAAKTKPLNAEERYQQSLVAAKVFCEDSEARVNKVVHGLQAVGESNYWFYGYFGANMVATMAVSLMVGNRVNFFRRYCGWIAVAGGYFGGKACLGFHTMYLTANVLKVVEKEITDAKHLDDQTDHSIPQYKELIDRYTQATYKLNPTSPEAMEAASHQPLTLDDRVDDLVSSYMKRKEALKKK